MKMNPTKALMTPAKSLPLQLQLGVVDEVQLADVGDRGPPILPDDEREGLERDRSGDTQERVAHKT